MHQNSSFDMLHQKGTRWSPLVGPSQVIFEENGSTILQDYSRSLLLNFVRGTGIWIETWFLTYRKKRLLFLTWIVLINQGVFQKFILGGDSFHNLSIIFVQFLSNVRMFG